MITIQNDVLHVGVNENGAELASIQSVRTGLEYMWEADPTYWHRHSCILFPVIGRTNQSVIRINNKDYPMSMHGIVRDRAFELIEQSSTKMTFAFVSDEKSQVEFPFDFEIRAIYEIENNICHVTYEVYNEGVEEMPFSIGAHPAFKCPLYSDQKRSDYKLKLNQLETQNSPLINNNGLISKVTKPILNNENEIIINDDLFDEDALILHDFNSDKISFIAPSGRPVLSVVFEEFTHLGIWSRNQDSPFVCIEPWFGIADPEDYTGEFKDKPGILTIGSDEVFTCRHSIILESP